MMQQKRKRRGRRAPLCSTGLPVPISIGTCGFVHTGAGSQRPFPSHAGDPGKGKEEQGGGHQEGHQDQAHPRPGEKGQGVDGREEQEQEQPKEAGAGAAGGGGEETLQIGFYLDPS